MSDKDQQRPGIVRRTVTTLGNPHASLRERAGATAATAGATAIVAGAVIAGAVGGVDLVGHLAATGAAQELGRAIGTQSVELGVGGGVGAAPVLYLVGAECSERRTLTGFLRRVRAGSLGVTAGLAVTAAVADGLGAGGIGHVLVDAAVSGAAMTMGLTVSKTLMGIGTRQTAERASGRVLSE